MKAVTFLAIFLSLVGCDRMRPIFSAIRAVQSPVATATPKISFPDTDLIAPDSKPCDDTLRDPSPELFPESHFTIVRQARRLAAQTGDRVVILTATCLFRIHMDKTLDASFGHGGSLQRRFLADASLQDMVIDDENRILVLGNRRAAPGQDDSEIFILRYLPDGAVDSAFAKDGVLRLHVAQTVGLNTEEGAALVRARDGHVFIAATASGDGQDRPILIKFNPESTSIGSPDDVDSLQITSARVPGKLRAIALSSDGFPTAAGYTTVNNRQKILVVQWDQRNQLRAGFGQGDGHQILTTVQVNDIANDLKFSPGGKLWVLGSRSLTRLSAMGRRELDQPILVTSGYNPAPDLGPNYLRLVDIPPYDPENDAVTDSVNAVGGTFGDSMPTALGLELGDRPGFGFGDSGSWEGLGHAEFRDAIYRGGSSVWLVNPL